MSTSFQCFYLHLAFIDRTFFTKYLLNVQVSLKLYFGANKKKTSIPSWRKTSWYKANCKWSLAHKSSKSLGWRYSVLVYVETVKCRPYNWAAEFKKQHVGYSKHTLKKWERANNHICHHTAIKVISSAHIIKFRLSVLGHWMYTVCVTLTWKP